MGKTYPVSIPSHLLLSWMASGTALLCSGGLQKGPSLGY